MPESLVDSQFETLEFPKTESDVVNISIDNSPQKIVNEAVAWIKRRGQNE